MAEIHLLHNNHKITPGGWGARRLLLICIIVTLSLPEALSQDYFQQEVNYKIDVSLNDKLHVLNAFEKLEYINHSPDTLHFIYFHLWPNAYSDNNTPLARQIFRINGKSKLFDDPELSGYIDSLDFMINGRRVQWNILPDQPDICRLNLNDPLNTGDTIHITTPFRVKIPKGVTSRLGHIGESYQISQWFPKPAVYDRDGWHQISYLDQGEFYSEFGSFDVSITLPDNYIVGATGTLQNQPEVDRLEKLAADTSWMNASHIGKVPFPPSSKQVKTVQFTAGKVHDFAWFADKRFNVMKGKIKLPHSGRDVTTWVMFTNRQSNLWKDALGYVNDVILWASQKTGDYPYESFTAVQSALSAGYGMEYPGITVIGMTKDAYSLDEVLSHETLHSWFYSALASNERKYPFMDEGITSAYTARYMKEKYPLKKLWQIHFKNWQLARFLNIEHLPAERMQELEWLIHARSNLEQPISIPATEFSDLNYGIMLYNKASIAFNYLRAYLGDSIFDATMSGYYRNWTHRHPQPGDLRSEFETITNKDLTWFFDDLLGTTKRLDYQMVRADDNQLLIKNRGELISPLVIAGISGDSIFFKKWVEGFEGEKSFELPGGDYTELKIDPAHEMPEINRMNNNISKTGSFPLRDPIETQLLYTFADPEKHILMYLPVVNWTRENGFMTGMAFHNGFIIPKRIEYFVMPFYAFGNNDLAGFGRVAYNITPYDKYIRLAQIYLEVSRFGAPGNQNYQSLKTGAELYIRNRKMNSPYTRKLFVNFIAASNLYQIEHQGDSKNNSWMQLGYQFDKNSTMNPFTLQAGFESGQSYLKTTFELNYKVSYYGQENGLDIRFFAGTMLKENSEISFYSFSPGGRSGRELYLFQGTYPDRFAVFPTSFWSRQMSITEGALVSPVNDSIGYSQWLVSLSFTSSLPGKASRLPVRPFINLLLNDNVYSMSNNSPLFYEAGLKMGILNVLEIYLPLLVSKNIDSAVGSFNNRIRFVFSLNSLNRLKMISKGGT